MRVGPCYSHSASVTFPGERQAFGPRHRRNLQHQQAGPSTLALPSLSRPVHDQLLFGCVPASLGMGPPPAASAAAVAPSAPSEPRVARPRTFLEELAIGPRKPRRLKLPQIRGAARRLSGGVADMAAGAQTVTAHAVDVDDPEEAEPLELLTDVRWILFPTTLANQPRDVELSLTQRMPGSAEHEALLQMLRRLRVLRGLADADLEPIARACKLRAFPRYAAIVRAASQGKACYVLLSGDAAALTRVGSGRGANDALVPTLLSKGAVLDETALVSECLREASVAAVTDCVLLSLTREALLGACKPAALEALLGSAAWAEVQREVVHQLLGHRPFFKDRTEPQLNGLCAIMDVRHVEAGTTIFHQGDLGKTFYVLIDGEVVISKSSETRPAGVAADGQGGEASFEKTLRCYDQWSERPWFGELALWLNKAVVREACRLLVLEAANFDAFLALVPEFRPYLNRRNMYKPGGDSENAPVKRAKFEIAEGNNSACTTAAFRLASSGKLGGGLGGKFGGGKSKTEQRAIFAERWERIVYNLLYKLVRDDDKVFVSKVSFQVDDYT